MNVILKYCNGPWFWFNQMIINEYLLVNLTFIFKEGLQLFDKAEKLLLKFMENKGID